ncbi:hypothetical protein [Pseudoduganella violaceinigra]|uniref:hypothetical protein n=1 Tax=Pseudoduganella violaceinigra TaxID=246602 RepID=UPI0004049C7E|nr:hypothetical protein [Pseudoduganella violaceinigra]
MSGIAASVRAPLLRKLFTCFAVLMIGLALAGACRNYSPVPFWDMWGSYLHFLDAAANGDWHVWWAQHNEHRIVLARLFFWADLRWFDGAGWFLIAVNYTLVALGALLFWRILRQVEAAPGRAADKPALAAFLAGALFFWSQHENLTWGFQSQFILAQLVPLAALYALYRAIEGGAAVFALACLLGVLSAGTMANGVLALPLMAVYALLTRQGARRTGVLALLAALVLFAYFHDYAAPAGHGSLSQSLREHPLKFAGYVLNYLGSPFHFAFGAKAIGRLAAMLAGLFLVASAIRFAFRFLRQPRQSALPLALLCFIAYIGGTAFGTAGGRLIFGLSQALSPRYTTPALMAWAALALLYAPALLALQERSRRRAWGAFAVLALLMLAYQLRALHSNADELFGRTVAALAVELRIKDQVEIGRVAPDTEVVDSSVPVADQQRSVFGLYPYRGARADMGKAFAPLALPPCRGALALAETIEGDARFLRVSGWLYEPAGKTVPRVVRILDADGKQAGYALGGWAWNEAAAAQHQVAREAGYRGYLSSAPLEILTLRGEGPAGPVCQLQLKAPAAQHN